MKKVKEIYDVQFIHGHEFVLGEIIYAHSMKNLKNSCAMFVFPTSIDSAHKTTFWRYCKSMKEREIRLILFCMLFMNL